MGQYYRIGFKNKGKIFVNSLKVKDDGYQLAKLMEHSYLNTEIMDAVANFLYMNPTNLLWCGDYVEDEDVKKKTFGSLGYEDLWGDGTPSDGVTPFVFEKCDNFKYGGKFLINHDKRQYVSFDKVLGENHVSWSEHNIISPISLLTALGNGLGCGDYNGENSELVGSWVWDTIEINDTIPSDYDELDARFTEQK